MDKLPLEGIRVVAVTGVWAGPFAGSLLADWGAEVIRVESLHHFTIITRGFPTIRPTKELVQARPTWVTAYPDWDPGEKPWNRFPVFQAHGRNKLSCTMNLRNPKGILLEEFIEARGFIGAIVGDLNKKGGSRLNVSKRVFAVMNDDLNKIASSPFRKGRQARLAKEAIKRAKLEFSVERFQDKVAQFTKLDLEGKGIGPDDMARSEVRIAGKVLMAIRRL